MANAEQLKKKYDDLAARVTNETAPGTPEHHRAMQEKKAAFAEYKKASDEEAADLASKPEGTGQVSPLTAGAPASSWLDGPLAPGETVEGAKAKNARTAPAAPVHKAGKK